MLTWYRFEHHINYKALVSGIDRVEDLMLFASQTYALHFIIGSIPCVVRHNSGYLSSRHLNTTQYSLQCVSAALDRVNPYSSIFWKRSTYATHSMETLNWLVATSDNNRLTFYWPLHFGQSTYKEWTNAWKKRDNNPLNFPFFSSAELSLLLRRRNKWMEWKPSIW